MSEVAGPHLASDLSLGGVFVSDVTVLEPGTRVVAEVELRDGDLTVSATVRWVRPTTVTGAMRCGLGLAFDELDDDDTRRIAAALEEVER